MMTPAVLVAADGPSSAARSGARVAIVTGASRGIGAATALRLARDGFAVTVNYRRGAAEAESIVGKIREAGGRGLAVQADVTSAAAVSRMFDLAERELGGVDVVVSNAGVMHLAPIREMSDAG
jgi:3-oxoacyl-[acyl-carrier protein] reductase